MLYWCSFADPTLPKGKQFLGATIIDAVNDALVAPTLWVMGRNPGGEIKFAALEGIAPDEIPDDAKKYCERFIPREEALADQHLLWKD